MFLKTLIAGTTALLLSAPAQAATVSTSFIAGFVDAVSTDTSVFDFTQFQIGERVRMDLTIEDSGFDFASSPTAGFFRDLTATLSLVGVRSGTVLALSDGAKVRADSVTNRMSIDSALGSPTADSPLILKNAIDFQFDSPILSDANSLAAILADVVLDLDQVDRHSINFFTSTSIDGEKAGLWLAAVPLPASGLLLIGTLGLFGVGKRRAKAA